MTNDIRRTRVTILALTSSRFVRARLPVADACTHVGIRAREQANVAVNLVCSGIGGLIRTNPGHTALELAIGLPIQHVQPSTCIDTINQIN